MSEQIKFYIMLGLFGVLLVLGLQYCDKKQINNIVIPKLKPIEQEAIIVNPDKGQVTIVRRDRTNKKDSTVVTKPVNGARNVRIGISPDGRVIVTARTKGFIHEPGFIGAYGKPELRVGGDIQVAFWNEWGLNVGVTTTTNFNVKPFIGVSYTLEALNLNNTSILLGIDSRKEVLVGLRVRL